MTGFGVFLCVCCSVTQLCPTLCNPIDYSPPGSTVRGISQARILVLFPSPGDLPDPGIEPTSLVSPALAGGFFATVASKTVLKIMNFLFRKNSMKKNNKSQLQSRDNSVYILSHLFSILKICTCVYRIMLCIVYVHVYVYVLHLNGKRWVDFSIKYT